MIGSVIAGKYRLTRELGKGGMGAVYEAVHVGTSRRVAVKLIKPSGDDDERMKGQVARFQREAVAAGRLETQHVVQVYDAGTDETTQQPYLAMELLEGEDVSQLIRRIGPLREDLALAIVTQACAGLQKAHDAGVIHRDIKPSNLFLAKNEYGDYTVKVLDFGIAKVNRDDSVHDAGGTITETGTLVGSPHYMSPEQAKGLKTIDHRSDLWSIGVVLHKCLSGRTPFDGNSTLGQVIVAVCSEDPVSVQEHAPWVRPELSLVLRQALRRDPNLRFQSAMHFLEALRGYLPGGPRINASMIVPLTDQEVGTVMPRRSEFPTQATPNAQTAANADGSGSSGAWLASAAGPPSSSSALPSSGSLPRATPSGPMLPLPAMRADSASSPSMSTRGSFVTSPDDGSVSPSKKRRVWPLALVAVAALGIAAIVAVPRLRTTSLDRSATAAPVSAVPSSSPAPAASEPASATVIVTTAAPVTAKAKVAIAPAGAHVEVDDVSTKIQGGFVVIEGAPGSVHKVKVAQGGRDSVTEVVLTDKGPMPAKVTLDTTKPAVAAAPPAKTSPQSTPAAKPATAPATTKAAGGFDRSFE